MSRIVICCDGTSASPDKKNPTNVLVAARAIDPEVNDGGVTTRQITFYDAGVGSGNLIDQWFTGGLLGHGLNKNIEDAYRFLMQNYTEGDEVFLFGFSRGAYTVRSLVGMIYNVGLLKKSKADKFDEALKMYRARDRGPTSEKAKKFRHQHSREMPVRFLGVWDTVGVLGILFRPFNGFWERRYGFHDAKLSEIVDHAYQALAIDEKRRVFKASVWERDPYKKGGESDRFGNKGGKREEDQIVEQVWFSGVHSDVGGSYDDHGLSDITLRWMIAKAGSLGLKFDEEYVDSFAGEDVQMKINDSRHWLMKPFPAFHREIGITNSSTESVHHTVIANPKTHRPGPTPNKLSRYLESGMLRISDQAGGIALSQGYASEELVTVPASSDGYDTGIALEAGATYELEAKGRWNDDWILCRPDGVPVNYGVLQRLKARIFQRGARTLARLARKFRLWPRSGVESLARFRLFALVGEVRQANGAKSETFLIGFGPRQLKPSATGDLIVRPNDYPGMYGNNSGELSLEVRKVSEERAAEISY